MAILIERIELNDNFDKWRDKINKMISTVRSVEEYPDQTGKEGWVLSTNGTNVEWISKQEILDEFGINAGDGETTVFPSGITVGNFACNIDSNGNITTSGKVTATGGLEGDLTGNASTATQLKNSRTIDGVSFNGTADITHYGTCNTAAGTGAKVIKCTGFSLKTGSRIQVQFSNTNTANLNSVTFNVNNTGAKKFYIPGTNKTQSSSFPNGINGFFCAGCIYNLIYDGTAYYVESMSYGNPTYQISSSVSLDLNACIYPGIYYCNGSVNVTNTPGRNWGWLEVIRILEQGSLKQVWYTNDGSYASDYLTYIRASNTNGSTYSTWVQIYTNKGDIAVNGALTVTGAIQGNSTINANGNLTTQAAFSAKTTGYFGGALTCASSIIASGNITGAKVLNAVYNDYAEFFERGENTEEGDIIALDSNSEKEQYVKATYKNCNIVGIDSRSYGHLIGGEVPPEDEDFEQYNLPKFIPVGLVGRVPVKVIGKVHKGDTIILSDIPGVGKVKTTEKEYYKIGFSVENNEIDDIKLVRIKISL